MTLCSITFLYLNQEQTRSAPQFPREFSRDFLKFDSSALCGRYAMMGHNTSKDQLFLPEN